MAQSITIEKAGARLYFVGNTFGCKDKLKSLGCHWDGDRRAWWIGAKKEAEARALLAELNGVVVTAAASVGLASNTPAAIVAGKLEDEGRDSEAAAVLAAATAPQPKEDPANIRLTGKGRYKGREYYAGSKTHDGLRVRLLTLPDANGNYLDFWADTAEVERTKTYEPRQVWDGRRYSGKTRTVYTTLGSIADFIAEQRAARANGEPVCAGCGKAGGGLVRDLEDGLMKHPRCCDIEP